LADGLVQQTFQAAATVWSSLRDWSSEELRTWLRGTMHHIADAEFRRIDLAKRMPDPVEHRHQTPQVDTERDALTAIALERYWQIIDQMPHRQHLIALMRWRGNMKPSEIAAALDMLPDAVSSQIDDARRILFAGLNERAPFAQDDIEGSIPHPGKEERQHGQRAGER
jgi:DNA-directed RNA polymerase specialized sigma24 family protein